MNAEPWIISHTEFQQFEIQFITLRPVDGFLSGEQLRGFFMQSNLPPAILGQVWQLADLSRDGKLDKLEFCIAMKLCRNVATGLPLPPVVPESLKRVAPPPPAPLMRPPAYGQPLLPQSTMAPPGAAPPPTRAPPIVMGTKELCDWTVPQDARIAYVKRFNQHDKERRDFLTGQQLRGMMSESQLPPDVLAQIWSYADANKEGCLTVDRFCIALYLIDKVKEGYALPKVLPPELRPTTSRSASASPATPLEPGAPPPQKAPAGGRTFEDRRRDNLDRGEAELERRRQVLREQEEQRRAEIERRERAEAERREREREEAARIREAELQARLAAQREVEAARAAEEAEARAARDKLRKAAEDDRIRQLAERHINDLEARMQDEREKTAQIKQRHSTMSFQLQGLDEKADLLSKDIGEARDEIMTITSAIEAMRGQRDEKIAKIQQLQQQGQETAIQTERFSHVNLQLQTQSQSSLAQKRNIESLRKSIAERTEQIAQAEVTLADAKQRYANQQKLVGEKRPAYDENQEKLKELAAKYNLLFTAFIQRQQELHQKVMKKRQQQAVRQASTPTSPAGPSTPSTQPPQAPQAAAGGLYEMPPDTNGTSAASHGFGDSFSTAFGDAATTSFPRSAVADADTSPTADIATPTHATASGRPPVKYRALYEFNARSDDEISFECGDTILVFEDHPSEEGWLCGQVSSSGKSAVGYFPAAFAEPAVAKKPSTTKQASIAISPSAEPLASIKEEESADKEAADAKGAASTATAAPLYSAPPLDEPPPKAAPSTLSSLPLYDAPPGNEAAAAATAPAASASTAGGASAESREGNGSTSVLASGTATYAWKARRPDELSFARGDTIEVLEVRARA